ncbi:hypothetical protein GW17_00051298 [Ensete ventricosum]|nr:hypothetical protein GW17_00051298 [Ensete ventricosum]
MGLITHNRIKLCISTSPCPVIVNLVIIGSAAALPGDASARKFPSYGRRTCSRPPLVGWPRVAICRPLAVAPAAWPRAAFVPCGRRVAAGHPRATTPVVWPRAGAAPLLAGLGRSRPPLCMGALAAVGRPLQGAWPQFKTNLSHENLGSDTTVGKPTAGRSYIPVFQIRMEKMKEVKRPPL